MKRKILILRNEKREKKYNDKEGERKLTRKIIIPNSLKNSHQLDHEL